MKYFLAIFVLFISEISFADQYSDIPMERLFTNDELKSIGVEKLSKSEVENLRLLVIEKFIQGYEFGKKETSSARGPDSIESKIDGDFEGWDGETVVKLVNGQIWQQSEYYYTYHYAYRPDVLVFKNGSGYRMKVDGVDKAVGVTRLK